MISVRVRIKRTALVKTFSAMRQWLDHNRCESLGYFEHPIPYGLLVEISFMDPVLAAAFSKQFGGVAKSVQSLFEGSVFWMSNAQQWSGVAEKAALARS
jgi:hypothetical protein